MYIPTFIRKTKKQSKKIVTNFLIAGVQQQIGVVLEICSRKERKTLERRERKKMKEKLPFYMYSDDLGPITECCFLIGPRSLFLRMLLSDWPITEARCRLGFFLAFLMSNDFPIGRGNI